MNVDDLGRALRERPVVLVLGAGGPVAHGFHAGVLSGLSRTLGWNPNSAELIVGTSAGAGTGALIRAGLEPDDLYARMVGDALSDAGRFIAGHAPRVLDDPSGDAGWRWPASPRYLAQLLARPWRVRVGALVTALMPRGRRRAHTQAAGLRRLFADRWPTQRLWIVAADLDSGARVVFGSPSAPTVDVGTAVVASSAVPGVREPVRVKGTRYVDGAILSPTHLRVLEHEEGRPLVLVSSPLSRMPGMRGRLRRESRALRRRGFCVHLVEPGPRTAATMGWNPLSAERSGPVAKAARAEIEGWICGA